MGFNPQQPYDDLPALPLATRSRLYVPQWRRPNSNPSSTCPKKAAFYACPQIMFIAWTCRSRSAHFLKKFGYVDCPGHRCGVWNLWISSIVINFIARCLQIGMYILSRRAEQGWGAEVIGRLSRDLWAAFPQIKGFTVSNVLYMRAFAQAWSDLTIVQQTVGQLPRGHSILFLNGLNLPQYLLVYVHQDIEQKSNRVKFEQLQA